MIDRLGTLRRVRSSSGFVVWVAVVAVLLGACDGGTAPTDSGTVGVDDRGLQLQRLRTAVDAVAEQQSDADARLFGILDVVRVVDDSVPGMLSADSIDATIAAWKSSGGLLTAPEEAPDLREGYLATAREVDDARTALATARRRLEDPWERQYLTAEDDVLTAVRAYAEDGDRLAQMLQRHWPTYAWFHGQMQSFVERRWQYRSDQEAADAFFVETDTRLESLREAQRQIESVRRQREQAAARVNDASEDAQSVWEARPSDQPTDERASS